MPGESSVEIIRSALQSHAQPTQVQFTDVQDSSICVNTAVLYVLKLIFNYVFIIICSICKVLEK